MDITTTTTTETTTETTTAPFAGEQLATFTFERDADPLGHSGVWVHGASYGDDLRACNERVASFHAAFGVTFYALYIPDDVLRQRGPFAAIKEPGWYAATTVHSTPELRRIVQRAYDRARAMTPRASTESEA